MQNAELLLTSAGEWEQTHTLAQERAYHSSWASPQGVMLIGGEDRYKMINCPRKCQLVATTEVLKSSGDTRPGFNLLGLDPKLDEEKARTRGSYA